MAHGGSSSGQGRDGGPYRHHLAAGRAGCPRRRRRKPSCGQIHSPYLLMVFLSNPCTAAPCAKKNSFLQRCKLGVGGLIERLVANWKSAFGAEGSGNRPVRSIIRTIHIVWIAMKTKTRQMESTVGAKKSAWTVRVNGGNQELTTWNGKSQAHQRMLKPCRVAGRCRHDATGKYWTNMAALRWMRTASAFGPLGGFAVRGKTVRFAGRNEIIIPG